MIVSITFILAIILILCYIAHRICCEDNNNVTFNLTSVAALDDKSEFDVLADAYQWYYDHLPLPGCGLGYDPMWSETDYPFYLRHYLRHRKEALE